MKSYSVLVYSNVLVTLNAELVTNAPTFNQQFLLALQLTLHMQSTGCLALKRNDVDVVTSSADRRLEFLLGDTDRRNP